MKNYYLPSVLKASGLLICFVCLSTLAIAGPPPAESAPIDGGLSVLLAAGAAAGVRKAYQKIKKANQLK
ncbi:PID-CTERM protein-sorting domain-containing protein [Tellurirhabdus bombi]|uniref:PID-CTERM protein-sorting domain-containing protein n=1 Tax=Tellurirhabdus bombi TaxID=2907205 RepID=UPI001F2B2A6F|nr:hypothetical protein [Tellurirhabdus bombi]